ncbi:SMI1/KNR4 family protein [Nonomuraea sp. PA05]|uniref:SMI1/KNR4 family protein n=1 Tax=Nonomuraea sp. PA05 TaxID=2604466 RepID=UPI0011D45FDB|nr:SMI1/KNR4 family protein [Nonomuraea sp. PA05]TYB69281.1 SMI1/KNR4 family protein [Nonomuraea sp. PA05]
MTEDELVEAIRATPELLPPAAAEAVADAERAIGHPLPPLLRRLYLEVANGGFGPRDGILGVAGSQYEHHGEVADIVEMNQGTRADWPGRLWLFDWGCGIWSVVDLRDPAGPMWIWDPNIDASVHPEQSPMTPQNLTLAEWLAESVKGNLEKAFETSDLSAVAERRRRFDARPGDLDYTPPQRLADDEIVRMISRMPGLPPPAPQAAVTEAEQALGFSLPPLLRRIYLEVANGGIGPGRGILSLPTADTHPSADIVTCHEIWTSGPDAFVPPGLVWLCPWGSAIWSLVDCSDPAGIMWIWDPMGPHLPPDRPDEGTAAVALPPHHMTLGEWLTEWLAGSFTKDFRPADLRAVATRRAAA